MLERYNLTLPDDTLLSLLNSFIPYKGFTPTTKPKAMWF